MQEVTAGGRRELVLLFHFLVFVGETSGQTQMLRKRRRCFGTARRLAKGWRPASVCQLVTWWQINNRNSLFCFVYFLRQYRNWDVRPGRSLPRKEHAWILGPENSGHCRRHSTQTSPARTEREKHPAQRQSSLHRQHVRVAPLLLLARTHLSLIIQIFDLISLFFFCPGCGLITTNPFSTCCSTTSAVVNSFPTCAMPDVSAVPQVTCRPSEWAK